MYNMDASDQVGYPFHNLLDSFGVSAGKGDWTVLAGHPAAVVNLLLLAGRLPEVTGWAVEALRHGARRLLLLGYKGDLPAFALLTRLGRATGAVIAADDYTRRRLGLSTTCGEGFVRIALDGSRDRCCFPTCEFRAASLMVSPCMVSHQATKEGLYSRIAQSCQVHWSNQWLILSNSVRRANAIAPA